ncbi:A-kinase anchor protein 1, mitochondrial [Ixodes scapularis]|uniref:A-kinase anchor protein 1, mitochondrial n=1 Tax=Ixodes scapularis TaxID=6945 RepID=UPI001C37E938|nr:A-kinase anchor protein 1, mitochondrial [Ixodes scapularis]
MAGLGPRAAVTLPAAAALVLLLSFFLLKRRRSRQNSEREPVAPSVTTKQESPGDSRPAGEPSEAEKVEASESSSATMRLKDEKPNVVEVQLRGRAKERSPPAVATQHGPKAAASSGEAGENRREGSPKPVADLTEDSEVPRLEPPTKCEGGASPVACGLGSSCPAEENVVTSCMKSPCVVLTVDVSGGDGAAARVLGEESSGGTDCVPAASPNSPNGSVDSLLCLSSPSSSSTASPQARKSESAVKEVQDHVASLSLAVEEVVVARAASEVGAVAGDPSQRDVTSGSKCSDSGASRGEGGAKGATVAVPPADEASPDDKSGVLTQALVFSDAHSEGSSDSGKGGSDIHGGFGGLAPEDLPAVYEFELPRELCGRFIGQGGRNVAAIKARSNASIYVHQHPLSSKLKLCTIEGTQEEIRIALDMIRKKFPLSAYPSMTLVQVNAVPLHGVALPDTLQLRLPDGVTCDVVLTSLVTAGHFFLQQPTHPTYPSLARLDQCMLACYAQGLDTPPLPRPAEAGIICAAQVCGGWFRALVVGTSEDGEECDIKFLDYGGYMRLATSLLRQIRSDFMMLPFQASECYLANVQPAGEDGVWSTEACATFEDLAQGQILQALIVGYADNGIPLVHLYRVQGVSSVFINRELVTRGVACWLEHGGASL